MQKYVIIMAGGLGLRMGGDIPKQFLLLDGKPIIMHTIERFCEYDSNIKVVVVLPDLPIAEWSRLCTKYDFTIVHSTTSGGDKRFYSVKNGLKLISADSLIAVHDGVRPLVSNLTIRRCFETAEKEGNAIPVIATSESVREISSATENRPLDRNSIKLVQTPQVFRSELLNRAYDCGFSPHYTDDATVVERLGVKINLVEGNRENIKITTPEDMLIAESIIKTFK